MLGFGLSVIIVDNKGVNMNGTKGCGCAFCERTARLSPIERACTLLLDLAKVAKSETEAERLKRQAERLWTKAQQKAAA